MVGWIKRFFCPHTWEVLIKEHVDRIEGKDKRFRGYTWLVVQRCKKCGKVQKNIITVK